MQFNSKWFLVSFFVCLLAVVPFSASATFVIPSVSLSVDDTHILQGEDFNVMVFADVLSTHPLYGDEYVTVFGFDIGQTAGLTLNNTVVGPGFVDHSALLSDTDVSGALPFIHDLSLTSGSDVLLATLNFTAAVTGSFTINILSDLTNPNQGLFTSFYIPSHDLTSQIDVQISPVPLPGSIIPMLFGLICFLRTRSRKINTI